MMSQVQPLEGKELEATGDLPTLVGRLDLAGEDIEFVGRVNSQVSTDDGVGPPTLTGVQLVTVTVTDVNEAPSLLNVPGMISLAENTQRVIQSIESSDPEGETKNGGGLVYSLSGADVAKFIIGSGGKFSFRSPLPDFETPMDANMNNVYEVTVTVTDSGGLVDTQDILVTITDVVGM